MNSKNDKPEEAASSAGAARCGLPPFLTPPVLSILLTEVAERFSYFGFRAVLVLYFHNALGYDETKSVALFAYVSCSAYLTPVFGAIVADAYLGRFATILWFGLAYFGGLVITTIGAFMPGLDETDDTETSLVLKKLCTLVGLGLACIGTGGIKPCVSAFGADQVSNREDAAVASAAGANTTAPECDDRGDMIHLEVLGKGSRSSHGDNGKEQQDNVRSFFSYFYFCINVGAVLSIFIVPIIRGHFGFGPAFLCPTLFLCFAMIVFFGKRSKYIMHKAGGDEDGSSLYTTFCVFLLLLRIRLVDMVACCVRGRRRQHRRMKNMPASDDPSVYIDSTGGRNEENTVQQTEASDASWKNEDDAALESTYNRLGARFSRSQISEAEQVLHIAPILMLLPVFWMLYDQQGSVWTLQATRMELHGLQPEQLNIINPIEIMMLIPLFERLIYPSLEARRWKVTHLRRMTAGMLLTAVSFTVSGLLESAMQSREEVGANKLSVFWQVPQITILAVAEILLSVTGLEFSYANAPESMRALIMAIYLLTTSVGDFLGGLLYSSAFRTLNRAVTMHVCAAIMLVNLAVFARVACWWEASKVSRKNEQSTITDHAVPFPPDENGTCSRGMQTVDRRKSAMSSPSSSSGGDYVEMNGGDTSNSISRQADLLSGVEMATIREIT